MELASFCINMSPPRCHPFGNVVECGGRVFLEHLLPRGRGEGDLKGRKKMGNMNKWYGMQG